MGGSLPWLEPGSLGTVYYFFKNQKLEPTKKANAAKGVGFANSNRACAGICSARLFSRDRLPHWLVMNFNFRLRGQ
jgi:hypothetical protein